MDEDEDNVSVISESAANSIDVIPSMMRGIQKERKKNENSTTYSCTELNKEDDSSKFASDRNFRKLCKAIRNKLEDSNLNKGKAFSKFDVSGDGLVTTDEFITVLRENFNLPISKKQASQLIKFLDDDNNGYISHHELSSKLLNNKDEKEATKKMLEQNAYRNQVRSRHHKSNFVIGDMEEKEEEQVYAPSNNNKNDLEPDIYKVIKQLKEKIEGGHANNKAFSKFDRDGDGAVETDEFLTVLRDNFMIDVDDNVGSKLVEWLDADKSGTISFHELSSKLFNDEEELAAGKLIAENAANRNMHRPKHHKNNFFIGDDRGLNIETPFVKFENSTIRKQILDALKLNTSSIASALKENEETEGYVKYKTLSDVLTHSGLEISSKKIAAALGDKESSLLRYDELPSKLISLQRLSMNTKIEDGFGRISHKRKPVPEITVTAQRKEKKNISNVNVLEQQERSNTELFNEIKEKIALTNRSTSELFQGLVDKHGSVSHEELISTLRHINVHMTDEECKKLIRLVDKDEKGEVNTKEFDTICQIDKNLISNESEELRAHSPYRKRSSTSIDSKSNLVNNPLSSSTEWDSNLQYIDHHMAGLGRKAISPRQKKKKSFNDADNLYCEKLLINKANGRVERVRAAFKLLDGDGDGQVTHDEFSRTLLRLGLRLKPTQLVSLITQYDPSGKGYIDYFQFADVLANLSGQSVQERARSARKKVSEKLSIKDNNLGVIFSRMDTDLKGYLDYSDVEQCLKDMGVSLIQGELQCMLDVADKDHNGKIDYTEFIQTLRDHDTDDTNCLVNKIGVRETNVRSPKIFHGRKNKMFTKEEKRDKIIFQKIADRIQSFNGSFRDIFLKMDTSGDHQLDKNELKSGLENLGVQLSDLDFSKVWRIADSNGNGEVSLDEFVQTFGTDYISEGNGFGIFTSSGYSDTSHNSYRTSILTQKEEKKIGRKICSNSPNYMTSDVFNITSKELKETSSKKRIVNKNFSHSNMQDCLSDFNGKVVSPKRSPTKRNFHSKSGNRSAGISGQRGNEILHSVADSLNFDIPSIVHKHHARPTYNQTSEPPFILGSDKLLYPEKNNNDQRQNNDKNVIKIYHLKQPPPLRKE